MCPHGDDADGWLLERLPVHYYIVCACYYLLRTGCCYKVDLDGSCPVVAADASHIVAAAFRIVAVEVFVYAVIVALLPAAALGTDAASAFLWPKPDPVHVDPSGVLPPLALGLSLPLEQQGPSIGKAGRQ